MSRIEAIRSVDAIYSQVDLEKLAREQQKSKEIETYLGNKLSGLEVIRVKCGKHQLVSDVSTGKTRPVVPLSMRRDVFKAFHDLAHAGPRPTQRGILQKFVWKNLKRDVVEWCKSCDNCQKSKHVTYIPQS